MPFDPPNGSTPEWPDNVTPLPTAREFAAEAQRKAFDSLAAEMLRARARELTENMPAPPTSEELMVKLMAIPAANGEQLGVKLRLFAIELSKEAEFGQNPDHRLIPFFASIQRDCLLLLQARLPEDGI